MNIKREQVDRLLRDGDYETTEKFQYNTHKNKKKKFKKFRRQKPEWKRFKGDAY